MAYDIILQRINSISKQDIYSWCDEYIDLEKDDIIKKVKDRLKHGESVFGNGPVGYYKLQWYSDFKRGLNPLADGNVDLFRHGDLFKGMTIQLFRNDYKIFSTDEKYEKLGEKYGFEEFGLTEYEHEELLTGMQVYVMEKIFEKILK